MLLVHGAFGASAQWYAALPVLVAASLRVVAADAPGHGESEVPSWRPEATPPGMLSWTDELVRVLKRADALQVAEVAALGDFVGNLRLVAANDPA